MAKVLIFGCGQIADVTRCYLEHDSPHEVVGFTVDRAFMHGQEHLGYPVVPFETVEVRYPPGSISMFLPISYRDANSLRAQKYAEARAKGYALLSYVSSKAQIWPGVTIGDNCFILENNVVQPFSEIGSDVILWSGNHIGHHSTIGDHCFIASQVVVSGGVRIGDYSFLGVNSTIRDGITIAPRSVIAAGAVVLKDTEEGGVYGGNPARKVG